MKQRKYTKAFKEELVQAMMNGRSPSELSREFKIARQMLYYWHDQALNGNLKDTLEIRSNPESRIKELEQLVGRLMADNELLKKALKQANSPSEENEISSGTIEIEVEQSCGGAEC